MYASEDTVVHPLWNTWKWIFDVGHATKTEAARESLAIIFDAYITALELIRRSCKPGKVCTNLVG